MAKIEIIENVILIRINRLYHEKMSMDELYEATRGIWRIGIRREKADFVFAVYKGEVVEVYSIISWFPACTLPYKTRNIQEEISNVKVQERWEFDGKLADESVRHKYIGKSVKEYFMDGASNPVMYINC